MTTQDFRLPDVGEGLTEADILTWHVKVGDVVEVNQAIVDIETAKSVVELPSPWSGTVAELLASEGETVPVGEPIIRVRTSADGTEATDEAEPALLVGYGAREPGRRRRRGAAEPAAPSPEVNSSDPTLFAAAPGRARAKPPVRLLAKQRGLDLASINGSGPEGIVTRQDVERAGDPTALASDAARARVEEVSETAATRIPIKGVRKHTAAAVVSSAFTAPHVTEFVTLDVTPTLELRSRVQVRPEFRDVKLTPLAFVARAYLLALARTPIGNARWEEESQEIVIPAAVNLGVAAATPRGLIVPNIKFAQALGLRDLAGAILELATTARSGKTPPEDMSGGTTTITNVGVFGVDTGTPILNPGESAILAVGAVRRAPWVVGEGDDERLEIRSVMQLALSFDHRVIDGQQGSQLLADTAAFLTDPGLAFL